MSKISNNHSDVLFGDFLEGFEIDQTAKQIVELKAAIFDIPDISEAKVEFFKDEIASGRFEVHCEEIAEKLIEHHMLALDAELM